MKKGITRRIWNKKNVAKRKKRNARVNTGEGKEKEHKGKKGREG